MAGQVDTPTTTEAERLAELIHRSPVTVALTGAGISVPSGIPDFRTPGKGLWTRVDPMKVAHIDAFHRDTAEFWRYYRPRFEALEDKEPNAAHVALAELEGRGLLEAVITQNIDRLHRKAGSRNILEVHGSIATSSCLTCGARYELEAVDALFDDHGVAVCGGCLGKVKPDVVLFGELLPESTIRLAQALCERADLLICVGSSLEVHPVASLPDITLESGGKVAIVTQSETPYDAEATVRLHGDVVRDLEAVISALPS